jgi:hypothetical protein
MAIHILLMKKNKYHAHTGFLLIRSICIAIYPVCVWYLLLVEIVCYIIFILYFITQVPLQESKDCATILQMVVIIRIPYTHRVDGNTYTSNEEKQIPYTHRVDGNTYTSNEEKQIPYTHRVDGNIYTSNEEKRHLPCVCMVFVFPH